MSTDEGGPGLTAVANSLTNFQRVHKDPVAQLQELAKKQSEELLKKLGGTGRDSSDLPPRPLPFGSEELVSPTYVAQSAGD